MFIDKRHAADGRNFVDQYAALSFDGGDTWQPNLRLTEMSSDIRFGPPTSRGIMLGDYMGVAPSLANDQPCVAIWCDTRSGDSDPFTVRFTPSVSANYEAWARTRFTRAEWADPTRSEGGADLDADQYPNYLEYALANDPRRIESGEAIYVQSAGAELDAARAVRAADIAAADLSAELLATGRGVSLFISDSVQITPTPLPPGLVWKSSRLTNFQVGGAPVQFTLSAAVPVPITRGVSLFRAERTVARTDARLINVSTRGRSGPGASHYRRRRPRGHRADRSLRRGLSLIL